MGNYYRFAGIDPCEVCNGLGFGVTLFLQGCSHRCEGCHNPSTWDANGGMTFDELQQRYLWQQCNKHYIHRLTISGGEPFQSLQLTGDMSMLFKYMFPNKKLWIYTGYKYEDLPGSWNTDLILANCDVLVDGPFVLSERDITLPFRGSRNQRIIDVPATLKAGRVIELEVV